MFDPVDCYFSEAGKWLPGKVLSFVPTGTGERNITAVVAAKDGRVVSAKLEAIRHGTDMPKSLPAVHGFLPGGARQHTIKFYQGRYLVASPDGIIKGDFETEEEAKARHAALEPTSVV